MGPSVKRRPGYRRVLTRAAAFRVVAELESAEQAMPMIAATIGATAHRRIRRDGIRCCPGAMIGGVQETIELSQGQNLVDWRTAMLCREGDGARRNPGRGGAALEYACGASARAPFRPTSAIPSCEAN